MGSTNTGHGWAQTPSPAVLCAWVSQEFIPPSPPPPRPAHCACVVVFCAAALVFRPVVLLLALYACVLAVAWVCRGAFVCQAWCVVLCPVRAVLVLWRVLWPA